MYMPKHFEESRVEVLHALIRRYPLGALVVATPQGLEASHVPFEVDPAPAPYGTLRCHLARANPLWSSLGAGAQALVIFQGADSYVSPSWYVSKREHGKVVPTWNYATVHAHGSPRVIEDAAWLKALVERLTAQHEAGRPDQWRVDDAPADYIEKQLRAIVGVEIPVSRLLGKWKLSQNRSTADRHGVITGLEQDAAAAPAAGIAELMKETLRSTE